MNRADLLRLHALHKAAAAALEARLKNAALGEYTDNATAVSWRLPDGMVLTGLQNDHASVMSEEMFLDYAEEHASAVTRREVREVPKSWQEGFLKTVRPVVVELATEPEEKVETTLREPTKAELVPGATFSVVDLDGRIVPGVTFTVGGRISSISIRLDDEAKETSRKAAYEYAAGDITLEELLGRL